MNQRREGDFEGERILFLIDLRSETYGQYVQASALLTENSSNESPFLKNDEMMDEAWVRDKKLQSSI